MKKKKGSYCCWVPKVDGRQVLSTKGEENATY